MFNIFIAIIIIIGFLLIFYQMNRRFKEIKESQKNDAVFHLLNQNIQGMQERIDNTTRIIGERLDNAAKVISGVSKELGQVQEMGRQMKDLQDFLKSPKLRGNVGEQILKDLLEQILPHDHFKMQYSFKEGQAVDAVIKTERGLIPIDSKFPMENFRRMINPETEEEKNLFIKAFAKDVKKHIDDISKKYILPAEGTVDFAVMYVPSETVYYEVIMHNSDLNTYAQNKKVFLVSPNSFYYFLKIILMGLQEQKIAEGARQILRTLSSIQHESKKFGENLGVLHGHITRTKNAMDEVSNQYSKLSGRIDSARMLKEGDSQSEEAREV